MKYEATGFAHDSYERGETIWYLQDGNRGLFDPWPKGVAEKFAANHQPGYEIGYKFVYDDEADSVVVTEVTINGQTFSSP